jgi:hypothetical protein
MSNRLLKVNGPDRMRAILEQPAEVLYLIPHSATFPEFKFHGSTKDVDSRREYFKERAISTHEFCIVRKEETSIALLESLEQIRPLSYYRFILLDLPGTFPLLSAFLRSRAPKARLLFRSHNAEFLHRLDWMKAESNWRKKVRYGWEAFSGRVGDKKTLVNCDQVLPISDWDAQHYWKKLEPRGRAAEAVSILPVPYFLASDHLPAVSSLAKKDRVCVCVGAIVKSVERKGGGKVGPLTPLATDMYRRYSKLVAGLSDHTQADWQFLLTGSVPTDAKLCKAIHLTGVLHSPFEALANARAVCQLSELGRGFKTKILDALASRAFVLMPVSLYERLPLEVMPFCIPMAEETPIELEAALEKAQGPWPEMDPNAALRARAFLAMDAVFQGFR